jgi:outer membrane protein
MYKSFVILLLYATIPISGFGQNSFSLPEAVQYGIQQSNEIKLKNLAVSDAGQQIKEIRSIGVPKVSASVNYQHYLAVPSQPVQDFLGPTVYGILFNENVIPQRELGAPQTFKFTLFQPNTLSAGVEASSLLFDGSYIYGLKAARFYRELVMQEKEVSVQKIKENVTKAYLSVLLAEENLKVLENNRQNLGKSLNEVQLMFQNGFAESLDMERLQLSYDNLVTEISNISQLIAISKNILKFQMNYPINQDLVLTQSLADIMVEWNNITTLENAAIQYADRQEYKLLQLGEQLNNLDYKRTQAAYYPTLRGFANFQGNLFRKDLFNNDETGWIPQSAIGLALQVPIYDGGEKSAKLQRIQIRNMETAINKQTLETSIQLQVSNAYLAYVNASKSLENRRKALEKTNGIYNKTLVKFREGVGSSLEVTQAESELFRAQAAYTEAGYNVLSAILDWKAALGKL